MDELKGWLYSLYVMGAASLIVFVVQKIAGRVLNIVFEVCIFHIPTLILLFIYFYLRFKVKREASKISS
ncbi:TPA: hypothetical protein EYP70_00575 [Candidatus Bathyarchaeota archaeon]|nr:hypothetical protein [Candidatus Bathyarchaeota archaeon]